MRDFFITELNSPKISLQLSKGTSVTLKWDHYNWLLSRIKKLIEEPTFSTFLHQIYKFQFPQPIANLNR